ncbi:hypothetical protein H9P43_007872 [Blastocladiella emersonii ATCC 22665]|nr:hypothetical protein H9P43_007872 [Blastocladiella emersonii ATCC 22665]
MYLATSRTSLSTALRLASRPLALRGAPLTPARFYTTPTSPKDTPVFPLTPTKTGAPLGTVQVYEGPLARTVRLMKLFSISSLGATLGMAPLVYAIDVSDVVSDAVKTMMMGTAIGFSAVSTSLIHWCLSSYVTRIHAPLAPASALPAPTSADEIRDPAVDAADYAASLPSSDAAAHPVIVETVGLRGHRVYTPVALGAVRPNHVIFGTWHADAVLSAKTGSEVSGKKGGKKLFVHADAAVAGVLGEPARVLAEVVQSGAARKQ